MDLIVFEFNSIRNNAASLTGAAALLVRWKDDQRMGSGLADGGLKVGCRCANGGIVFEFNSIKNNAAVLTDAATLTKLVSYEHTQVPTSFPSC